MSIRTFDQLTDTEVVQLTDTEFKHFCALEMMSKGVVIPKAPPEVTEKLPKLATTTYFRPKLDRYTDLGIVFSTAEEAAAFLALHPVKMEHNYAAGYDSYYAKSAPDLTIEACELPTQNDYEAAAADMIRINAAKTAYQKDKTEYDKQAKAAADAVEWMVERREKCMSYHSLLEQIRRTNTEYVALCEGNARAARNFLSKRYGASEIEAALGKEDPQIEQAKPAESDCTVGNRNSSTF